MGLKLKSKVTTKPEKKLKTVENSLITGCLSSSPQIEEDAYIDSLDVSICTMSKSSKSSDISSKDNEILNTSKEKDKISIEIQTQILMIELNEKFIIKRVTKSKLQSEGIAWIGMQTRIDCELQHCGCNLVSPTKSNSKKVLGYTRIISMSPYDRFQADTADLSSEIQKGCKEGKVLGWKKPCILFLVKDHFAKYLWSFLIQSKNAISVKTCLEQLFLDGYIPKILHTDNGSEFKGDVSKLLSKFNIKHVKGRPYNPKCQGLVENSNRYVKKYLQLAYLTNHQEVFNITSVLKEITLGYNKRPHSVTKVEPEKAFINPSKKLLVEIRERSVKYYNQAAQNFIKLEVNDRIGVSCKIEISEKGFLRLKKINLKGAKASFFHTLGIIEEVLDFGKVKIKVEFSLEDINVGETFYCDSQILHVLTLENYEGTLRVLSGNNLN